MKHFVAIVLIAVSCCLSFSAAIAQDLPPARDDDKTIVVPLNRGWNMISINIQLPVSFYQNSADRAPSVVKIMEKIQPTEARDNLVLIKNGDGHFYTPEWGFCNIESWNSFEAYQVCVTDDCSLVLTGRPIDPQTEIPLHRGWNLVSYLPDYSLSMDAPRYHALESILDVLSLAIDGEGRFACPELDISNMPAWRETRGYQIRVTEDTTLIYPPDIVNISCQQIIKPRVKDEGQIASLPEIRTSSRNMSLLVEGLSQASLPMDATIEAIDAGGVVVGSGKLNADGRCGFAVWGEDGVEVDGWGLLEGEPFALQYAGNDAIMPLTLDVVLAGDGLVYQTDALTVVSLNAMALPLEFQLVSAYPNPFNSTTKINVAVDETQDVSLKIFNLNGQLLTTLHQGEMTMGNHSIVWNAEQMPAGTYLCRLTGNNNKRSMKITLVK